MKKYNLRINGHKYDIAVESVSGSSAEVSVNGVKYNVELPEVAPVSRAVVGSRADAVSEVSTPAPVVQGSSKDVKSPLPGVVLSLNVKEGEVVKRGQKVAVVEAMKMENEIRASRDGIVSKVYVAVGDSLLEGAAILRID